MTVEQDDERCGFCGQDRGLSISRDRERGTRIECSTCSKVTIIPPETPAEPPPRRYRGKAKGKPNGSIQDED